jgi:hypothetical protein
MAIWIAFVIIFKGVSISLPESVLALWSRRSNAERELGQRFVNGRANLGRPGCGGADTLYGWEIDET